MENAITDAPQHDAAGAQQLQQLQMPPDDMLILAIRHYFTMLRQEKGHHPEASPMDLEILLVLKFVCAGSSNPVDLLKRIGLIVINTGEDLEIAIDNALLLDIIVSSRSRINNTLKKLHWDMQMVSNSSKWNILKPLLDRADVRNWTIRRIPPDTPFYDFVHATPEIQFNTVAPSAVVMDISGPLQLDLDVQEPRHSLSSFA